MATHAQGSFKAIKATKFSDFDKDGDGRISEAEFVKVGRLMDSSKSRADYQAMYASLDQDRDRGLNLEELAAFFSGTQDARASTSKWFNRGSLIMKCLPLTMDPFLIPRRLICCVRPSLEIQ